jgi:hypothetical protein
VRKEVSLISSDAPGLDRRFVDVGITFGLEQPLHTSALVDTGATVTVIKSDTAQLLDPERQWETVAEASAASQPPMAAHSASRAH